MINESLGNLQTIKMKNNFYAKHLNRYMGDTIAETTESPPRFSNKMVPNRNEIRLLQNKSMQRMN